MLRYSFMLKCSKMQSLCNILFDILTNFHKIFHFLTASSKKFVICKQIQIINMISQRPQVNILKNGSWLLWLMIWTHTFRLKRSRYEKFIFWTYPTTQRTPAKIQAKAPGSESVLVRIWLWQWGHVMVTCKKIRFA